MASILDTPQHVGAILAFDARRVGEGGTAFPDHLWISVVALELNPGCFRRQAAKFVNQGNVQARYLPTLVLTLARAVALLQGAWFVTSGRMDLGDLVAFRPGLGRGRGPAGQAPGHRLQEGRHS